MKTAATVHSREHRTSPEQQRAPAPQQGSADALSRSLPPTGGSSVVMSRRTCWGAAGRRACGRALWRCADPSGGTLGSRDTHGWREQWGS